MFSKIIIMLINLLFLDMLWRCVDVVYPVYKFKAYGKIGHRDLFCNKIK